jgi:DNA-binding response OmpR family regulator
MSNESRILLVDDEPDIALAFKIGLEDNGFNVDVFDNPSKAL